MWILNAGYIEEEVYEIQMKDLLNRENEKIDEHKRNGELDDRIGERWETMKDQIKSSSIRYSKERRRKKIKEERVLRERLREELDKAEDEEGYGMEKYIEVKTALEKYEREKCRGATPPHHPIPPPPPPREDKRPSLAIHKTVSCICNSNIQDAAHWGVHTLY